MKKINIVQIGLGPMGKLVMELLLSRENISVLGAVDIDPKIIDKSLSEVLGIERGIGIIIKPEVDGLLSKGQVDLVVIATSSSLPKVYPLIKKCISAGSNVISICEELSYPFQNYPQLSKEIDTMAKLNEVTVVGTGINPGYLMDLLPIVITAPCQSVDSIKVRRMMNSTKRREPFQRKIGTGLAPEIFREKMTKKEITGHVGLKESIQMISNALGFNFGEIIEFPPEEVIAEKDFETSYGEFVPKGNVCGLKSIALAKIADKKIITLEFIAYAGDHEEYDEIIVEGKPRIHQKIIGGVHGDLGTSAMVVNLIPNVLKAKSGLLTMKDLPVPCYTENIYHE